jgi:hypothetical protein
MVLLRPHATIGHLCNSDRSGRSDHLRNHGFYQKNMVPDSAILILEHLSHVRPTLLSIKCSQNSEKESYPPAPSIKLVGAVRLCSPDQD